MKRKSKARNPGTERNPGTGASSLSTSPSRNRTWLLGLILLAATLFAYQPAWNAGFIWDDDDYVTHNPLLTAPDGLQRIWFSTDSPSQYFPLVYTTFRLERALWGLHPAGYHWVNLLLHAINALLAWRLLKRLRVPGAWLAAAIFALHPVNVESVAWITQLKNVLSMFFILLTLLAWVEFVKERPVWRWYGLALVFYALALFSKTTACIMPAALLLVLWLQKKPLNGTRLAQVFPFVALGVGMGLISMWWEKHHQGTEGATYAIGLLERVLVSSRAVWFYAGKLLWPANLTFNYPLWKISAAEVLAYVWLAAGAGLCVAIYYARRFVGRSVEVAAMFYVAALSPLLGFFMLYTFRYTFVADHYQYVATLGPIALVAAGLTTLFRKRAAASWSAAVPRRFGVESAGGPAQSRTWRFAPPPFFQAAFCGALLITLGVLTWRQCTMYANLETLWRTTLARNPDSFMAHNNLGAVLLGRGRVDEAITHFQEALEILPENANAHGNLGHALLQKGQVDEAIAHFRKALEIEPNGAKAHSDLGFGLLQKGQVDEAIAHARTALEIQPGFAEAHNHLGWALLEQGQVDEAIAQFQKALEIQPDSADTCYNLGTALLHKGQVDQAIAHFQRALKIRPDFAKVHNNLGSALLRKGQADEALAHLQKALEIQPDNAEARNNLGWVLLQNGRLDEAIAYFQSALKLQPDFADAHFNLGNSLFQSGRVNEAIVQYEKILTLRPDNAEVHNNLGWILLQNGRLDEAIAHFHAVLKIQPDFALAHGNLAVALLRKRQAGEAIEQYQAFLKLQPESAPVLSDLAWVLATWPEAGIRNGPRALELAERANHLSGEREPMILRTLAAAYAESGKFAEAVTTIRRALELAEAQSNAALAEALRSQLKFYQAGSPFRDPPQPAGQP